MLYITDQNGNPIRIKACTVQMGGNYNVESVDNGDGTQTLVITDNTGSGADPVIEPLSVTENGTYNPPTGVDGFSPVTVNVSTGTSGEVESGVVFLDYDGTIVEVWNTSEVAGKTALPSNPTHDGLVAQGWNWSLTKIKSYISNYSSSIVYVGQMYKTASGLTEIDITVTKVTGLVVSCEMYGNKDWGDGTTNAQLSHTYNDYGDYTITCDGMFITGFSNINHGCTAVRIGEDVIMIDYSAFESCYSLTSVTIPDSVTSIGGSAFQNCYSLKNITIPDSVTSIDYSAFENCYSLTNITIPDNVMGIGDYAFGDCYSLTNVTISGSVTNIDYNAFENCHSLTNITIPDGVTSIGYGTFSYCYSLTNVTIPGSVTSIGDYAFYHCRSIIRYDFSSATSIPVLSDADIFSDINGICKIIVPDDLYDSWKTATNWSSYEDYIYKASEVFGI